MTPIPLTDTSRPPQFPCWIWDRELRFWRHSDAEFFELCNDPSDTHWHPDQPEAPKERPGAVNSAEAEKAFGNPVFDYKGPTVAFVATQHRQSDTPRVDAAIFRCDGVWTDEVVYADFARTLEWELNEAKQQLHALRLVCGTTDANKFETALDRALAKNRALEQELAATKTLLEAQLKFLRELRADRDRLDWLDENCVYTGGGHGGTYSFSTPLDVECGMLRAAIDAAM